MKWQRNYFYREKHKIKHFSQRGKLQKRYCGGVYLLCIFYAMPIQQKITSPVLLSCCENVEFQFIRSFWHHFNVFSRSLYNVVLKSWELKYPGLNFETVFFLCFLYPIQQMPRSSLVNSSWKHRALVNDIPSSRRRRPCSRQDGRHTWKRTVTCSRFTSQASVKKRHQILSPLNRWDSPTFSWWKRVTRTASRLLNEIRRTETLVRT